MLKVSENRESVFFIYFYNTCFWRKHISGPFYPRHDNNSYKHLKIFLNVKNCCALLYNTAIKYSPQFCIINNPHCYQL